MKKIKTAFFASLFAACFSGCVIASFGGYGSVMGKGKLEKYNFKVGEYNSVKADGFMDIHYYASDSDSITLEVQPNLLEYFVVEVIDHELIIRTTRNISVNSSRTPVLTVSIPFLNRLTLAGAGNFVAFDAITADSLVIKTSGAAKGKAVLDVKNLYVDLSGAGKYEFSGKADTAGFFMSGAGDLNAINLQSRESKIDISGAGKVSINCTEKLEINASGTGKILYKGSPSINISRSGIVAIKQVD